MIFRPEISTNSHDLFRLLSIRAYAPFISTTMLGIYTKFYDLNFWPVFDWRTLVALFDILDGPPQYEVYDRNKKMSSLLNTWDKIIRYL